MAVDIPLYPVTYQLQDNLVSALSCGHLDVSQNAIA